MISRNFNFILIISFTAVLLCRCKTEQIILHGYLGGTITDASTSQPVSNATIVMNPTSDSTSTGNDGKYIFRNLAPGNYDLQVSKESYFKSNRNINIYSDSIQSADFNLEKTPMCKISVSYLDFGFDSIIKRFTISNSGIGRLYYLVVADTDWITLSSSSNSGFLTDQTDTITVNINKSGLTSVKHRQPIIVWSNSGQNWLSDTIYVFVNSLVDEDLNYYNVVTIGSQTWMAENLNVGMPLENSLKKVSISSIRKHCYEDNEENCKTFGGLYEWKELMKNNVPDNGNIGKIQGICPVGWHIPTHAEWSILVEFLGGTQEAGGKMKETGTSHWNQPNNATGGSGFNALPGGAFFYNNFSGFENTAYFWSASRIGGDQYTMLSYKIINSETSIMTDEKDYLYSFSVRCVKDPGKK